ncbi:TerD family protein [Streptomyces fragilis]|uniref:TerD family protein n=1 Tax=Streptomyces fragilis TaxID=67301 RepID=A0ABV2YBA3_9ACTN|nr:TerD family protein [Streptomyces fragilis]
MTAELVRGQNHPLTEARPEVRVTAARPVAVGVVLTDEQGRLAGVEGVLLPGGPAGPPGVGLPGRAAGGEHRVTVEPAALPETVHRVGIVLALPAGARFGGGPAPFTAVVADGSSGPPLVSYTITGLDSECAVVALELYRRQGAWKVRAVGQGYAAGLAALLTDHGLPSAEAQRLAAVAAVAVVAEQNGDRPLPPPSAAGTPAAGTPSAAGASAAAGASSAAGTSAAGASSAAGTLSSGAPASAAGTSPSGTPASAAGTPAAGTPAFGTAASGTAASGAPAAAGPPAVGTPAGATAQSHGGPAVPAPTASAGVTAPGAPEGSAARGTSGGAPGGATAPEGAHAAPGGAHTTGGAAPMAASGAPGLPPLDAPGAPGAPSAPSGGTSGAPPGGASGRTEPSGTHTAPGSVPATAGASRIDYRHPRRERASSAQGHDQAQDRTRTRGEDGAEQPPAPVAGDAAGWSMEERLYNQVWGMFEDLARAVAAYRGAVEFADNRRDQEIDAVLGDYRARADGTVDRARREAKARREELVGRAQQVLDQQLAQLRAESEVVEPALPPAYARWESPVWRSYRAPEEQPLALRLGDLSLPESGALRIPLLLRLPLERGLWIDSGAGGGAGGLLATPEERRRLALDMAVALATRLLAAHPPGAFTVHVIDAAGAGARALTPLARAGVLAEPPSVGPAAVSGLLTRLAGHVDLVQMAVRAGAAESLPPGTDLSQRLLIVHDFPHAFDDRAVTALRYLADEGPRAGVHLLMVADREDAAGFGALLDPLWRSLLRLTPVPEDHLADPWVSHAWTYQPSLPPGNGATLEGVLARVAAARRG